MSQLAYRADIDGLRAVSVVSVMLFHAGLGCPGGFVGVDVFFVISGYLITSLIVRDLQAGKFSFVQFWERRVRRILPASLFVTACALLVGTLILMPTELEEFADSALAHLACSANFFFWLGDKNGYFTDSADYFPLLHMWSLSIEEQFYFVFPFLMYLLRNRSTRTIVALLSLIWIVSFATSLWGIQRYPAATFFTPPTRFWELLTGAILALLTSTRKRPLTTTVAEFVALAGMLGILVPIFVYDKFTTFPAATALPPV